MISIDEYYSQWGLKKELQQIFPPTLRKSDVQTSNKYIPTHKIRIYIYICPLTDISDAIHGDLNATFYIETEIQNIDIETER